MSTQRFVHWHEGRHRITQKGHDDITCPPVLEMFDAWCAVKQGIWVVTYHDRNTGTDVEMFTTRERALRWAQDQTQEHLDRWSYDWTEVEMRTNSEGLVEGWYWGESQSINIECQAVRV